MICRQVRGHPVAAFVTITFLCSWAAWLPLLASVQGWLPIEPWSGLHLLGGLGPALAAVTVIGCTHGKAGLRELSARLGAWRKRARAWLFVLAVPPLLLLIAAPISAFAGGTLFADLDWSQFGRSVEFAALPVGLWWLANLVFFGFGEEIGWRGFLQPHLEHRHSPVTSAGLVSLPWALWHLPLFAVTPSYRAMPLIGFVGFAMSIWVASWIFAWLLQLGRGSLLIVAVFHAWFDIVTTSPLGPDLLPTVMGAGITLIGLVVLRELHKNNRPGPVAVRPGLRAGRTR